MPIPRHSLPTRRRPRNPVGYLLLAVAGVLVLFTASAVAGGGGHWGAMQFWLAAVTAALAALGAWCLRRPGKAPFRSLRRPRRRPAAQRRHPRRVTPPAQQPPTPVLATEPVLVGTIVGLDADGAGDA